VLEGSLVNVLLSSIVRDLDLFRAQVFWTTAIYSLVFAALLITSGTLADRIGRRPMFVGGTVLFLVGSLLCGSAYSGWRLVGARAIEAVGGAMMLPTSMAIINVQFRGSRRAAAFGPWGAVFGGIAALGPLLGGWLAQGFSWRWAFFINIPVGAVSMVPMFVFVPESKLRKVAGFDPLGVVLSGFGLALIVFGLKEAQAYGWLKAIADFTGGPVTFSAPGISVAPVALAIGTVLLGACAWWELARNRAKHSALIDTSLFGIRRYGYGNVVAGS